MAIGPVGAATYANQVLPAQAVQQTNVQNRIDMQNALAAEIADENKEEVEEVRPTEESYKIDPENEHEKEKNQTAQEEQKDKKRKIDEDSKDLPQEDIEGSSHLLDIKV